MNLNKIAPLYIELLVLFLIIVIYSSVRVYQYNYWEQTKGEVVQIQVKELKSFTGDVHNEIPVIRYIANDRLHEIRATLLTGFNDLWAGDEVQLIYPKSDPGNARVLNFIGFWLPIPSLIIMIVVFTFSIGIIRILTR